jgi:hypothetical protein
VAAARLRAAVERMSLPDWAFYPLALGAVALMVWLALDMREEGGGLVLAENRLEVFGPELANIVPGPGVTASYDPEREVAIVASDGGMAEFGNRSAGAGFRLPAQVERAVIGQRLRLIMELRSGDETLRRAHIGYFTTEGHDSRWRQVRVGPNFAEVMIAHEVPLDAEFNGQEWIGVWPDQAGLGRPVEIRRMTVELLGPIGETE